MRGTTGRASAGADRVRVFVYGTLKRGHGNHGLVAELVETVEPATVAGFRLLDLGYFPGARPAEDRAVRGEVLTLRDPAEALARLDRLEGVPHLYTREEAEAEYDDGSTERVFVYVLAADRRFGAEPIEPGEDGADCWEPRRRTWTLREEVTDAAE